MRAAVVWQVGDRFDVRDDVQRRDPGSHDVVVAVQATGLCRTDLSLAEGVFGHPMPAVLGHEAAGVVTEVGSGVVDIRSGDHVVIDWVGPCGACWACLQGSSQLCARRRSSKDLSVPSMAAGGEPVIAGMGTATFAQETVVPSNAVVRIDDDVPFPVAAILGCAVATGAGAVLNTARVAAGDHVVVIGCGGVGLAVVQAAVAVGAASVVAVDPLASRQEAAGRFGASAVGSVEAARAVAEQLPAGGFDHAFDVVGVSGTIRAAWDAVRPGGQAVIVGAGGREDLVSFSAYELFHSEKRLLGSFYGSTSLLRDAPRLIAMWRAGRLDLEALVTATYPLTDINSAADAMRAGDGIRAVLVP